MSPELLNSFLAVAPAVLIFGFACLYLLIGMFQDDNSPAGMRSISGWGIVSMLLLGGTWIGVTWFGLQPAGLTTKLFQSDSVALHGTHLTLLAGVLISAFSIGFTPRRFAYEFHACFLLLLSGSIFLAAAADLTTLYLAVEMVSLPTTLLLSISRRDNPGREATLKYFAMSAFASAVFLMGASYLYGLSGTTSLSGIATAMATNDTTLAKVAMALVLAGLAFRVTAVPFHFYAPDVFTGSSLPVAAMIATLSKIAGFLAIVRLLGGAQLNVGFIETAGVLLMVLALTTMTAGNFMALAQTKWRRLLAYSSVAHSGYLLLGVAAALYRGGETTYILSYLSAYTVMTLGVFAALAALSSASESDPSLADLEGLHQRAPALCLALSICLLSLIGVPLTAGFWAKFGIFQDAIRTARVELIVGAAIMALNAAVGAMYYLSLLLRIYRSPQTNTVPAAAPKLNPSFALCVACAAITVLWFLAPNWM
jgi:NADH-quinone oxidoreductase subunit N